MKTQLLQLLLSSFSMFGIAQHFENPQETDVFSPEYCIINDSGFGGVRISDNDEPSENTYFYELKFEGENPTDSIIDNVLFVLEKRIADYLLSTETQYFTICGRRLAKTRETPKNLRYLQSEAEAVAITVNPRDYHHTEVECTQTEPESGSTCIVVEGFYRVYFAEGAVGTSDAMDALNDAVKNGMDNGVFVQDPIMKVTWLDGLTTSVGDQSNEAESPTVRSVDNDRGNSTPAIIGASVGGILAIGLLAFYRRRNIKNTDDDTTSPPGGSSTV